jgi:hypothetical protein
MRKLFLSHAIALLAGLAVLVSSPPVAGAPPQDPHDHGAQTQQGGQPGTKMGDMKMHQAMQEMMAKRKANTERIDALMARIRTASGDEKVAAMADVIAILVDERAAMETHCAEMCGMNGMMKK